MSPCAVKVTHVPDAIDELPTILFSRHRSQVLPLMFVARVTFHRSSLGHLQFLYSDASSLDVCSWFDMFGFGHDGGARSTTKDFRGSGHSCFLNVPTNVRHANATLDV